MTRPYRNLSARDRAMDAADNAAWAANVGPMLDAASLEPQWVLRTWRPSGAPREFDIDRAVASEVEARQEYRRYAELARCQGGAVELLSPSGDVAASFMSGGGA